MITTTELQLLACFGVEPRLLDAGVPWCYNDATYVAEVDGLVVTFGIAPSYRDARIDVTRDGRLLFALDALQVADVVAIDEPGVDAVEIVMREGSWLRMQLRPTFEIAQEFMDDAHFGSQRRHT
jgi:hypothetical protein